jgi:quercetin dioxygenase-like cupin family protein
MGPSESWSTRGGTTASVRTGSVSPLCAPLYGCDVKSWSLTEIEAPGGTIDPAVLTTDDGARAIAIRLEAGQELRDHQVRERAWVVVVEGEAVIRSGGSAVEGRTGTLVTFDPGERHAISSQEGARVLLILAPWPGPGHYPERPTA